MTEIKQNRYFPTIGAILFLVFMPMEAANSIGTWEGTLPENQSLVFLIVLLVGFSILSFFLYRLLLKNQIRKNVHPHMFANTMILFGIGGCLLVSFFFLDQYIGQGWFAMIGSLYILVLLMFVLLGKALRPLILFLVILAAIVAFRLLDL